MSQENLDLARALADAFNRRDWDAFLALTDDGIEVESRLVAMEGAYHGREGVRRWWDNFLAGSATPIIDPFWQPLRWRDGKCIWWRNCSTEEEALAAAGLSE